MKKPIRIGLLLSTFILLTGCATAVNKKMESWLGSHESDLIAAWGPPNSVSGDGKGGKVLIYGNYVDLGQSPGMIYPAGHNAYTYTAPQQRGYQRTRMFYVDEKGTIYSWRWQGL